MIGRVLGKTYITPYHIVMFGILIPAISLVNYGLLWVLSDQTMTVRGWLVMTIAGVKIFAPLFLIAVWIGNMVIEDILWFVIQSATGWREPKALTWLLEGKFARHKGWVRIGKVHIPSSYLTGIFATVLVLILESFIANRM